MRTFAQWWAGCVPMFDGTFFNTVEEFLPDAVPDADAHTVVFNWHICHELPVIVRPIPSDVNKDLTLKVKDLTFKAKSNNLIWFTRGQNRQSNPPGISLQAHVLRCLFSGRMDDEDENFLKSFECDTFVPTVKFTVMLSEAKISRPRPGSWGRDQGQGFEVKAEANFLRSRPKIKLWI